MTDPVIILREFLKTVIKDLEYEDNDIKIEPISSGGANYTTQLFGITLSAENKEDLKLFAKVAIIGEKLRADLPIRIYETESYFYTRLLKRYREFEDASNVAEEHRLMTPKFYGCSEEYLKEVLLLEDLTHRGFKMFDRFSSVTWEYASKAFEELAKYHALSMTYAVKHPEEFEELATGKFKSNFNPDDMRDYMANIVASAMEVTEEKYKTRLTKFVDEFINVKSEFEKIYLPVRRPVLAHADFRPNNIMHVEKPDGTYQIVVLDFQTITIGNCISDILYFIFNSTDEQFRAKYYQKLLDHYYTELCQSLCRLGLNADDVYSREDFEYELKTVLPFGLTAALFTLPIVTVDGDDTPVMNESSEVMDFVVKPNELFRERLNGILSDYVKMGVI